MYFPNTTTVFCWQARGILIVVYCILRNNQEMVDVKRAMPFLYVTFFFKFIQMLHEWETFMDSQVNVSYFE